MAAAFRNLQDFCPEIPHDLWVIGYCVCSAESGNQQDIERKATYISNLNQFLAERQLFTSEFSNPEMKVEKVYLSFQDGVETGPPLLDQANMPLPKWVDMFNSFKKSKTYGGDGVDWNEKLREKVRQDQEGETGSSQRDAPGKQSGKGSKAAPPESSQGGKANASSSHVPPWERDNPWAEWDREHPWTKWNVPPGAYIVPNKKSTKPPPPKARPDTPRSRAAPKAAPEPPIVREEEWYSSALPEGIMAIDMLSRDCDGHNIRFVLWSDHKRRTSYAPAPIAGPKTMMSGGERQWRLYLRRVAYHVGVTMAGAVDIRYDMRPV